MLLRLFLAFLITICFTTIVTAQYRTPVKDSVFSSILNEQRQIEIILPDGFAEEKNKNFDVWYILDGEWNTRAFTDIMSYLVSVGFTPSSVIVSIPNRVVDGYNYRNRDLTTVATSLKNSGGAKYFLSFLQKELMPYIRSKYQVTGNSGLFGASYGGLFTLSALIEQPQLFNYYLLSDPAFQYGNHHLVNQLTRQLPGLSFKNTVLYIGGRSGSSYTEMGRAAMDSALKISAPHGLYWKSVLYDDETHSSVSLKTYYDGLKFVYKGYTARNSSFLFTGGMVVPGLPVKEYLETEYANIMYTTDGTDPTDSSAQLTSSILVSNPELTVVKSLSPGGRFDRVIPIMLHTGNYLSPRPLNRKIREAGKLDTTSRMKEGIMSGYLTVPADSYYIFDLKTAAGTQLYFNDSLLTAYDPQKASNRQTIILPLKKGNYSLRLKHSPEKNAAPLEFGVYRSRDGKDEWWHNVVIPDN